MDRQWGIRAENVGVHEQFAAAHGGRSSKMRGV